MATTKTGTAIDASGNAIDVTVTSLTNGTLADASDVMATLNDLETDVEGHSHSLDTAVGYDSMLASYRPPDTGDSTDRWRLVSGMLPVTISNGSNTSSVQTVTFATDSDQGDPSFTEAPRVTLTVRDPQSYEGFHVQLAALLGDGTLFTFYAFELDGGTQGSTIYVQWMAYGKVA